ncbi:ABC transporter permease [Cohnella fermenti]|uniref:ABC transporter permease n=1 Tax=Cohnella fermenti TaxID=2565925 RepID=A0A4S4BHH0_9BACL|nr:ABC transporter permease [Cohnella fermenti]THF73954.1 ABC transporter permease [Cohnella fermenti]
MKIASIAWKEVVTTIRDRRAFLFMLAFPIVLMLILGSALSNAFTDSLSFDELKLAYTLEDQASPVESYWNGFSTSLASSGVAATALSAEADGQAAVKNGEYAAYAKIGSDGIAFYGSSKLTVESDILQAMLASFANRYSLAMAAASQAPDALPSLLAAAGSGTYVRETSLTADRAPNSMDYYAMAMSTMIAFYACMSATQLFRSEKLRHTALRLTAAPLSKGELFAGKIIGSTVINFVFVIAVVAFSRFVLGAEWGSHYGSVLLLLFTEVLLAVSVGVGASYLFKSDGGSSVVMMVTQIFSFIGGAYFPLSGMTGWWVWVAKLSPLYWINNALARIIYSDDVQAMWPTLLLNVILSVLFLSLCAAFMRKKEAL